MPGIVPPIIGNRLPSIVPNVACTNLRSGKPDSETYVLVMSGARIRIIECVANATAAIPVIETFHTRRLAQGSGTDGAAIAAIVAATFVMATTRITIGFALFGWCYPVANTFVARLTIETPKTARTAIEWIELQIHALAVAFDRAFKTFPSQDANAFDAGGATHAGMIAVAAMRWIAAHIDTTIPAPDQTLGATSGIRIWRLRGSRCRRHGGCCHWSGCPSNRTVAKTGRHRLPIAQIAWQRTTYESIDRSLARDDSLFADPYQDECLTIAQRDPRLQSVSGRLSNRREGGSVGEAKSRVSKRAVCKHLELELSANLTRLRGPGRKHLPGTRAQPNRDGCIEYTRRSRGKRLGNWPQTKRGQHAPTGNRAEDAATGRWGCVTPNEVPGLQDAHDASLS